MSKVTGIIRQIDHYQRYPSGGIRMKCPHCNSMMTLYEKTTNTKSQVAFYRCSLCVAKHVVSSSMATADQMNSLSNHYRSISGHSSHNLSSAIV